MPISSAVVLSGSSENADFIGFLIQGRIVADGTTTAGAFDDIDDEDQQLACDNDVSTIILLIVAKIRVSFKILREKTFADLQLQ